MGGSGVNCPACDAEMEPGIVCPECWPLVPEQDRTQLARKFRQSPYVVTYKRHLAAVVTVLKVRLAAEAAKATDANERTGTSTG